MNETPDFGGLVTRTPSRVLSLPREILPGRFHMLTRRCTQRLFLLRPDDETLRE